MSLLYYNNKIFDHLVNDVMILTDTNIISSKVMESWLEGYYNYDDKNTSKAIERISIDLLFDNVTELDYSLIESYINGRLSELIITNDTTVIPLNESISILEEAKGIISFSGTKSFIKNIKNVDNLLYFKNKLMNMKPSMCKKDINDPASREVLRILASIKRIVTISDITSDKFKYTSEYVKGVLYDYKEMIVISPYKHKILQGINVCEVDNYNVKDIDVMFDDLVRIMKNQDDVILKYILDELRYIEKICDDKASSDNEGLTESISVKEYLHTLNVERFNNKSERVLGPDSDDDIEFSEFVDLYSLSKNIAKYELSMEASSKIITKGTEKVTKSIGNASAKSRGMGSSKSKVDQVKRGARIVDERASDAINKKLDQVMNITRDAKREKLITGKNTVKLGKALKTGIAIIGSSTAAKVALGPVVGTITTITGMLVAYALSKRTEEREKKRIMLELETELKIVKEKIEDSKGENNKEQKYQLMRIQANLEKEIARIKHGMRYY